MHTVIEGIYEDGKVVLDHKPGVNVKSKVKVVFEESDNEPALSKRPFGIGKGTIYMAPDFDDPLDELKDYM